MPRERMTRHELKTQDEITNKLRSFTDAALERKKEIIVVASAVVALLLAYLGWGYYSDRRNMSAQDQLAVVITAYTDPAIPTEKARYEKAIAEAQKTVDAYGSLPAGVIAKYYIGLSKDGLGDSAGATQALQEVIRDGDDRTKAVAQFALAGIYKKTGDSAKAVELLKELEGSGGFAASAVNFELGRVLEASNQPDQAKGYYEKVVTQFADSPFRSDAEAGLRRMGFAVPVAPAPANPS